MRNLVWERMRGEDRRLAREHRVASRETVPSTLDLVEAVGAHREVVDALMALPEHYRDVLVRRYYEGETPTEIADRQGTPVATVKTRLQRGLALLRQRLDELHGGDGRRWMSALGPLIAPSARPAPVPAAALTLKWVALLVALALPAGLWWWSRLAAEPRPAERSVAAPGALAAVDDVPPRLDPPATADRLPSGPVSDLSFTARRAAREASFQGLRGDVRGRVLGLDGGPVGGVVVRFDDDGMATQPGRGAAVQVTGDDGSFELRGVRSSGLVLAVAEGLVTVAAGRVDGLAPASGVTVVVAPARTLDGRVVGDHDLPLAGALVRLDLPQDLLDPLGPHAAHAAPLAFQTPGDVDGGFRMTVPRVAGLGLEVERSGYATRRLEVDALPPGSLWVTLERPSWSGASVSGWVLGPDGAPVPEARVAGGGRVTSTDPAGHFRLPAEGVDELVACAAGLGARRLPRGQAWPERVEITLPPAPSVIEGRVVDPGGQGLSGIGVWIADPTVLDPGRTEREEGQEVERFGVHPREFRAGRPPLLLEAFLAGEPERIWRPAETDREGRFRIEGLGTRAYTVVAGDPYTLIRARRSGVGTGRGGSSSCWIPRPSGRPCAGGWSIGSVVRCRACACSAAPRCWISNTTAAASGARVGWWAARSRAATGPSRWRIWRARARTYASRARASCRACGAWSPTSRWRVRWTSWSSCGRTCG